MTQITTVSTKGQLVIPAEMRELLGIAPGTRIAITVQGSRLVLESVSTKLAEETRGLFKGGPSLSHLLQRERRRDDKKAKW